MELFLKQIFRAARLFELGSIEFLQHQIDDGVH